MGNFIIYNIKTKAGWNLDKHGVKRILITQRNLNLQNSHKWVNYEGKVKSKKNKWQRKDVFFCTEGVKMMILLKLRLFVGPTMKLISHKKSKKVWNSTQGFKSWNPLLALIVKPISVLYHVKVPAWFFKNFLLNNFFLGHMKKSF